MDALVRQWREDTPGCANQIHFNNAASGLMPRAVLEAITAHLNREANLGGYESADDAEAAVEDAYAAVAKVLGAQPRNIAVVENSTVAFFQALSAFDFKDGDVIVTTRNDYISNQLAYLSLARRHGVEVRRGADWVSADSFAPAPDARRFENWEFAYSLVLGLGEAARYALGVDVERGGRRARELAAALRSKLSGIGGIRVLDRGRDLAAIVTIEVAGWDAGELSKLLRARGINSSASLRAYAVIDMDEKRAATALRLSPHYYNTEEELERVVEELKAVVPRGSAAS